MAIDRITRCTHAETGMEVLTDLFMLTRSIIYLSHSVTESIRTFFTSSSVAMPTIGVKRDILFGKMGKVYCEPLSRISPSSVVAAKHPSADLCHPCCPQPTASLRTFASNTV